MGHIVRTAKYATVYKRIAHFIGWTSTEGSDCTDEIVEKIYGAGLSLSRVGARIYDVRKKYKVKIKGWHDTENPKLYWYGIIRQNFVMPPAFEKAEPKAQDLF
jgi:hypothetical protein